ncbi:dihydroneopterin aldolase [Helicobacter cappadocius]|uniref:Dihydroneopterin aldolase n=1 Tax=Helicobacter cappadocius TaxID=3063998 RepID=A0AA90T4I9_9HELI|nr:MULTISPECIES: dihydroneopterin aldolase [unclassified Helicobacter]MDO7252491.1 dihydroneopterin aldolase [Helicobacter sp. faydin-H75]MDP2538358.1 dihydroneopterin aldolase [Helicobacter sp. faydin-H76]
MIFDLIIEDFKFKTIIGILDFEKEVPQDIVVDATISYQYDDKNFIDYMEIKCSIQKLLQNNKYGLLEEALLDIVHHLKNNFDVIKNIELRIKKLNITHDCIVGVKINKSF